MLRGMSSYGYTWIGDFKEYSRAPRSGAGIFAGVAFSSKPSVPQAALDTHERGPPLSGEGEQSPGLRGRSGPSPRPFLRRTPTGILRNCNAGFKSPIQSPRSCQSDGVSKEALQREVEELKQKDLALDQEIAQLLAEGYSLEELEKHISLLHEYNDIKDTGQMLLGKLATIRGVTTKELYPKFDLELTD